MPKRVVVKNVRKEMYGQPGDVVREGNLYKAGKIYSVDVTEQDFKVLRTARSLEVIHFEEIAEIEKPQAEELSLNDLKALEKEWSKASESGSGKGKK